MKKKILCLLMTLVLALSTSITAFASFTPEWVDDVVAKVDATSLELETADGFQFSMYLISTGGSFTAGCDALDTPVYAQNGSVYTISGDDGSQTVTYEVTLDEDGEVAGVKVTIDDNGGNVVEFIFGRVHHPSYVPMKAPTTDEDGYMGYYECICGKYFKDSDATNEIEDIDAWKTTPGMGLIHKFGSMDDTTTTTKPQTTEKETAEKETAEKETTEKATTEKETTEKETTEKATTEKETTAKADSSKKSPETGASVMGLGLVGAGVAILAALKKKEND